jgi:uncharacterized protein (TIGR03083 family)
MARDPSRRTTSGPRPRTTVVGPEHEVAGGAQGLSYAAAMEWATIVQDEGVALADAAAIDPDAAVPAAPGWDATELMRHTGQIHARTSVIVRTGTTERPSRRNGMLEDPPTDGVLEWYRATLDALVTDLRAIDDPDRPAWSFSPDHQRVGFWARRMAHETLIHRVDAEQAVGRAVGGIDAALGVDGIDELLTIFVPAFGADRSPGDARTVHLHTTDGDGEWLIRFDDGAITIERGHATGDVAVRGPAGELLLWLWGRRPLDGLDVIGDRSAADALRAVTVF